MRLAIAAIAILVLIILSAVGAALYFRFAEMPPEVWHVDPEAVEKPGVENHYLLRNRGGDAPALIVSGDVVEIAALIDATALAQPRTVRIAGSPGAGHMTYVQRSAFWGLPDAISIHVSEWDVAQVRVSAFSRSRFGGHDWGVNRARLERWLAPLTP